MNLNSKQKVRELMKMAVKMKAISGLAFLRCLLRRI